MASQARLGAPAPVVGLVHPEPGGRTDQKSSRTKCFLGETATARDHGVGVRLRPFTSLQPAPLQSHLLLASSTKRRPAWLRCRLGMQHKQPRTQRIGLPRPQPKKTRKARRYHPPTPLPESLPIPRAPTCTRNNRIRPQIHPTCTRSIMHEQ